jgi:hypothetical protein
MLRSRLLAVPVVVTLMLIPAVTAAAAPQPPAAVPGVDGFPSSPSPSASFDWRQRALDYDAFVYNRSNPGTYPTIQTDTTHCNMTSNTYKMPSYYGDTRVSTDGAQEAITQLSSVVGASLVGVDKASQGGYDYVDMSRTFYHPTDGVALNNPDDISGQAGGDSWWYTATANVLYYMLGSQYPDETDMSTMLRSIADKYYAAVVAIGGSSADFSAQGFDFSTMTVNPGSRNEGGDGAVGTAAIELWANAKFGDAKYLQASEWAMDYLQRNNGSMYYEVLQNMAPYLEARLNAQAGTSYDVDKAFRDLLSGSTVRTDWGTMQATWNGYDVSGLEGSRSDGGGYAFAMNSFASAMLASTAKYDVRQANAVGRWLLNLSNAARFFYADQMPGTNQYYGSTYAADPAHVIAYEGLRASEAGQSPRATGDPTTYGTSWGLSPQTTDLALYGGSWVGFLGAAVAPTNVAGVQRVDLNALDFFGANTNQSYLYYNPTSSPANVQVTLPGARELYDAVSDTVLAASASGTTTVMVPPGSSRVLVLAPANGTLTRSGGNTLIAGTVVGYRTGTPDLAYSRPVTVSSVQNGNLGSSLTDGTTATRWESQTSDPQWIDVDLGQPRTVDRVVMKWETASAKAFQIQTSTDDSSWTTVYSTTAGPGGTETETFAPVTARYVRVYMTQRNTSYAYSMYDLQVFGDDLAASAPVTVSSTQNGNLGSSLTDGTTATRWESQTSDPQTATVDLGSSTTVGRVVIDWEAASAKSFQVLLSTDGSTWNPVYSTTAGPGGTQAIAFAPTSARYIRLNMTQRNTGWAYSIYELEAYAD